jgi:DNA invertase Pin-like site-specific DNA recombinase
MIYGYARVSTDRQENSADAQSARLVAYCEQSGLPFGGLYVDQDQSAYRIPLNRRREGKKLCDALQAGDTVSPVRTGETLCLDQTRGRRR